MRMELGHDKLSSNWPHTTRHQGTQKKLRLLLLNGGKKLKKSFNFSPLLKYFFNNFVPLILDKTSRFLFNRSGNCLMGDH